MNGKSVRSTKILAVLMAIAILLPILPLSAFAAETTRYNGTDYEIHTEGDYEFIVVGTEAFIVKYNGTAGAIMTPTTLGGKPVTGIYRKTASGQKAAFEGNEAISQIAIGAGITFIWDYSFQNCIGLQSVTFQQGSSLKTIGKYAFNNCSRLDGFTIPNTTEKIDTAAFAKCISLSNIVIPNSVTTLEGGAFFNCKSLSNAVIGDGVASLPSAGSLSGNWGGDSWKSGTFEGCISLRNVTLGSGIKTIGYDCFASTALTEIIIPDNVTTIEGWAFSNCDSLTKAVIGNGVTSIKERVFYHNDSLADVVIGKGVVFIGDVTFGMCIALETINIPSNVATLGGGAFFACSKLKTAVIGNGVASLSSVGSLSGNWGGDSWKSGAFEGCVSLTNVTLGSGIKAIGYDCFAGTALNEIIIPDNVTTIEGWAFSNCDSLTTVVIGNSVTSIKERVFYHDDSLVNVVIGKGVTSIGDVAFGRCISLEAISIPSNVTTLGGGMFFDCSKLKIAIIGNGVTSLPFAGSLSGNWGGDSWKSGAFEGCTNLTSVTLGSGIIDIGYDCFAGANLSTVIIPAKVSKIDAYAFKGNTYLSSVYFTGNYPLTMATGVFDNTNASLRTYYINDKTGFENHVGTKSTYNPITVNFDNNGDVFATLTANQILAPVGGYVIEPVSPVAFDYIFKGWYKEASCTNLWNFTTDRVTANTTLYAKWDSVHDVAPQRPTSLQSSAQSGDTISLTWDAVSGATGYNVYVDGAKKTGEKITNNAYTITGLSPNTAYEIHVVATNSKGESPDSLILVARTTDHIHSLGEWTIRTPATASAAGLEFRKCTACEYEETREIPKLSGHTHNYGAWSLRNAATCAAEGVEYRKCGECGEEETRSTAKTTAHSYGGWSVVTAATTDSEGSKIRTCAVCSKQETANIPKIGSVPEAIEFSDDISFTITDKKIQLDLPMTAAELLAQILTDMVELRDKDGNVLSGAAPVGTGATLSLIGGNDEYTVVLLGDVNGDGKIQVNDARFALRAAVSIEPLSGIYYDAANVPPSAGVKTSSARKILRVAVKIDAGF